VDPLRPGAGLCGGDADRVCPAGRFRPLLHLMDRGYSRDEIIGSGLVMPWQRTDEDGGTRSGVSDLLRGRIVFPYLDADLRPVYFIGRMTDATPALAGTTRRSTRSSS